MIQLKIADSETETMKVSLIVNNKHPPPPPPSGIKELKKDDPLGEDIPLTIYRQACTG